MIEFINNFIGLFMASAPWLLLGLLIAGMMKWLVPLELLQRHMGANNFLSIVKSALIGAPLPLCSCGVIPAAIGLRRSGASKSATVSFLVATPETGVDSISVSYAMLGPFMAIMRPLSAVFSAIYAGILVMLLSQRGQKVEQQNNLQHDQKNLSCCQSESPKPAKKNCCSGTSSVEEEEIKRAPLAKWFLLKKINKILSFASGKLLQDITLWLLIGLAVAAVVKTWVPPHFLTQWGDGFLAMGVMALVGIPMYICATASTPVAAGFLALGVSPGAVLVFMLAGPATNLSTMGMIKQELGTSVLVVYIVSILSASISFGYFTNWLVTHFDFEIYQIAASHHHLSSSSFYIVSALILAGLMLRNLVKPA